MQKEKGVVYVAFGHLYLTMALFSMRSLRRKNSSIPVMIITNLNIDLTGFDFWSQERDILKLVELDKKKNREIKTNLYEYVPFDLVAYIDADTYILNDINGAWKFLDYFDIAFKLNPTKQKTPGKGDQLILDSSVFARDVPHFNGGVFLFRKSNKAKNFFKLWYSSFQKRKSPYDQVSLVDAIFKCDARVLPLTSEWNYFPDEKYYANRVKPPIIVHYTNRISYSLERELLKIAEAMGFDSSHIQAQIKTKRLQRRRKIGYRNWVKMVFYWIFFSNNESKKWRKS